jgi:Zn-dependent membrane protease YugP
LINLLQQTVSAVGGRGFIKINTYKKVINNIANLIVDFDASKFLPDKQMAVNIINLQQEKELRKILSANVDINFKIAKILCN